MNVRQILLIVLLSAFFSITSSASGEGVFPSADISARGLEEVDFPRIREIEPNVYVYEGLHSALPDGLVFNTVSMIVVTDDGVLVADGQGDVWQTKLMIEKIKQLTSQAVTHVVVASDHRDHIGGNAAFTDEYPDVQYMSTSVSQQKLPAADRDRVDVVDTEKSITLGGTEIKILNLGRAHTGGDLAVYLPETRVMFLGEIYMRGLFPAMRSAYPGEWVTTIEKAQQMDASWYIPGHGFVDDAEVMEQDLETYRQALIAVNKESMRLHAEGFECESRSDCPAVAEADWGEYEQWPAAQNQAPFVISRVYQEIEGNLDAGQTIRRNTRLIDLWAAGQPAFGEYVTQLRKAGEPRPEGPPKYTVQTGLDLAANPLLDYAFLNLEGHYDADSARDVAIGLRRAGAESAKTLLVRIPPISKDGPEAAQARVNEVLSLGADGVVLPHVRSADEARLAISFFEGVNVWSPDNPDGDVVVMLMVEDPDVFAELEEIASIPGYSALSCGIGSLTQALGGDREAAEELNLQVLEQSRQAGIADIITANTESVAKRIEQGFLGILVYGPTADDVIRLGRDSSDR